MDVGQDILLDMRIYAHRLAYNRSAGPQPKPWPTDSDIHPCGGIAARQRKHKMGRNFRGLIGDRILLEVWLHNRIHSATLRFRGVIDPFILLFDYSQPRQPLDWARGLSARCLCALVRA